MLWAISISVIHNSMCVFSLSFTLKQGFTVFSLLCYSPFLMPVQNQSKSQILFHENNSLVTCIQWLCRRQCLFSFSFNEGIDVISFVDFKVKWSGLCSKTWGKPFWSKSTESFNINIQTYFCLGSTTNFWQSNGGKIEKKSMRWRSFLITL